MQYQQKHWLKRQQQLQHLSDAIEDKNIRLIFLTGPRDSGKTILLKHFYDHYDKPIKKHYFSFDQSIVSKNFQDLEEFKNYMEIKLGINFSEPSVLMLNEIQYSNNIIPIIIQLLKQNNNTTIVVTSVYDIKQSDFEDISEKSTDIHVYPLDFFEFLEEKGIHTKYFSLNNFSKIILQEVQAHFEEYLIRGGYPSVVLATTQDQKVQALNLIIKKVFEKDAGYWFAKQDLFQFEEIVRLLGHTAGSSFKIKQLEQQLQINSNHLKKYLDFFENNHLFIKINHFFSDKTKEINHQKKIYCIDNGLLSLLTNTYNIKMKSKVSLSNFVFQEIRSNKAPGDEIMSYKKINMSGIDFIIQRADKSLVPVSISTTDSLHPPKMVRGFLDMYGDRVQHWIKLCPQQHEHKQYEGYTLHIIPQCMTKQLYTLI